MNILLIDDDYDLYELLNEYLIKEGFTCAHAPGLKEGLDAVVHQDFNVVILNVMLPGMNGFEVLLRLRENEKTAAFPVMMMITARGWEMDKIVGLEMGADDYLGNPFNPRKLVAQLRALHHRFSFLPPIKVVDDISSNRSLLTFTANGSVQNLFMHGHRSLDRLSRPRKKLRLRFDGGERILGVRGKGYVYLAQGD